MVGRKKILKQGKPIFWLPVMVDGSVWASFAEEGEAPKEGAAALQEATPNSRCFPRPGCCPAFFYAQAPPGSLPWPLLHGASIMSQSCCVMSKRLVVLGSMSKAATLPPPLFTTPATRSSLL